MFRVGGQVDQGTGILSHVEPRGHYEYGNLVQPVQQVPYPMQMQMQNPMQAQMQMQNPMQAQMQMQNPMQAQMQNQIQVQNQMTPYQASSSGIQGLGYAYGGRIGFRKGELVDDNIDAINNTADDSNLDLILNNTGDIGLEQAYRNAITSNKTVPVSSEETTKTTGMTPKERRELDIQSRSNRPEGISPLDRLDQRPSFDLWLGGKRGSAREQQEQEKFIKENAKPLTGPELGNPEGNKVFGISSLEKIIPYKTENAKKTDPKLEIQKEKEFLQSILGRENLTTAENALIIAKALGTPGGINAKIKAAGDLALPVIQARAKEDRELTLKAYERFKDKEKAEISANKKPAYVQELDAYIDTKKRIAKDQGKYEVDPKTGKEKFFGKTEDEMKAEGLGEGLGKLSTRDRWKLEGELSDKKTQLQKQLTAIGNKKPSPELQNKIDALQRDIDQGTKILTGYAIGGRVNMAQGGNPSMARQVDSAEESMFRKETDTEDNTIEDTQAGAPASPTSEAPVLKLSYEELRNRLPKEIGNDVVRILSTSQEALQDFAYIRTQQDVNSFNVKYRVSLVLPQTRV